MPKGDFRYDLKFGEKGENLVRDLMTGDELTVEVKTDRLVSVTGNIAIEVSYKGNPSGIMKTEADWWAYVLSGGEYREEVVILVKTSRLKKLVAQVRNKKGTVKGGDGKQSRLVLVPLGSLLELLKNEDIDCGESQ